NVPELRFPEFIEEWEEKRLGDLYKYQQGQQIPVENQYKIQINNMKRFIRIVDVTENPKKRYIKDRKESGLINQKDLIMIRYGASAGTISMSYEGVIANNLFKFVKKQNVDNRYFYFLLKKSHFKIKSLSSQSAMPALNFNAMDTLKFSIPQYSEQQKIGSFFSKLDRQIELEEQKLAKLEEQKKGYMQKIFSQELRFKDENGNTFEEWKNTNFNYFMSEPDNLEKGIDLRKDQLLTVKLEGNGVSKANINRALKMGSTVYYKRFAGQFIYGKQNFFNGAFGIVPKFLNNYYSSGDVPALNIDYSKIDSKYFINYISRKDYYKKKEAFSTGTGSKRIHEKTLLDFDIMLPSVEEQEKIGDFFSEIDNFIEKQSYKVELLKERKKGFLQKMFV